jgi:hypothetical protein
VRNEAVDEGMTCDVGGQGDETQTFPAFYGPLQHRLCDFA